ncbi:hypothetical protein EZ456_02100 [Pedobacter psychrodurus]|uniref:Secreted protein n=1 Tax=Pedobacter psychrodurus TaxID=2530456 RepID=A0A4R0Q7J7_9SPHI|nr:hypothetical protein [Pedobacter psychrodurus]TCD28976.1 hypothetical protein EZ456_02100 [Pedobacter psychrodurus]
MKSISITLIAVLIMACSSYAQVGCRTGDYIYTTANGTYFDGGSTITKFNATDRIIKRNFAADPNCGIDRNTADSYPVAPGTPANPDSKCVSDINLLDEGKLVIYNNADKVNCPIDDNLIYLICSASFLGFALVRKRLSL